MQVGDRVVIQDYSDAHGDAGVIIYIDDTLVLVNANSDGEDYVWPCQPNELQIL